jgi:hypothetical protein
MKMARTYVVYDERVWGMGNPDIDVLEFDTDNASVLVACDTLEEAKRWIKEDFEGGVVLSYISIDGVLQDQQYEWSQAEEEGMAYNYGNGNQRNT